MLKDLESKGRRAPKKSSFRPYPEAILSRIRELALQGLPNVRIADVLNAEGFKAKRSFPFTSKNVQLIRTQNQIPLMSPGPREFSTHQIAAMCNVTPDVVRHWVKQKRVQARRIGMRLWISLPESPEDYLKDVRRRRSA